MADGSEERTTVVVEAPITLDRSIEPKRNGVVLSYALRSDGDRPVAVRVRDVLPRQLAGRDEGFHSDHRPADWGFDDEGLVFEQVVAPDAETLVKYGIVEPEAIQPGAVIPDPVIEGIQPSAGDEEMGAREEPGVTSSPDGPLSGGDGFRWGNSSNGDADHGAAAGPPPRRDGDHATPTTGSAEPARVGARGADGASPPSDPAADPGTDEPAPGREETSSVLARGPIEEPPSPAVDAGGPGDDSWGGNEPSPTSPSEPPGPTDVAADEGSVLSRLLAELEDAELTDEHRELLRDRLGLEPSRSADVRLEHVESRMQRFAALADTMEGFIDEHGDGTEFLVDLEDDVAALEAAVGSLGDRVDDAQGERSGLRRDIEATNRRLDETADELAGRIDEEASGLADRLDGIEAEHDDRRAVVESMEGRLAAVEEEAATLAEDVEERHASLGERVAEIDEGLAALESDLEAAISTINEVVEDLAEDVEERHASLEDRVFRIDEGLAAAEGTFAEAVADLTEDVEEHHARIERRVSGLDWELGGLESDLQAATEDVDDRVADVERDLTDVAAAVDTLERSLSADLDEVREQVGEIERIRDALTDALSTIAGHEEPDRGEPIDRPAGSESGVS